MKILIVEPCGFMRLGIFSLLIDHPKIDVLDVENISEALHQFPHFRPNIIVVNMTTSCQHSEINDLLHNFLNLRFETQIYCYLDANYPESDKLIQVTDNFFIFKKQIIGQILNQLFKFEALPSPLVSNETPFSIFSDQEILVMNFWMSEMPNYRIARKLNISDRTVYVHKRHITQKIKVRNRLEFCFIYNLIKYFYWPINRLATQPLSRQIKSEILSLIK